MYYTDDIARDKTQFRYEVTYDRRCVTCGKDFETCYWHQKFCCPECKVPYDQTDKGRELVYLAIRFGTSRIDKNTKTFCALNRIRKLLIRNIISAEFAQSLYKQIKKGTTHVAYQKSLVVRKKIHNG